MWQYIRAKIRKVSENKKFLYWLHQFVALLVHKVALSYAIICGALEM